MRHRRLLLWPARDEHGTPRARLSTARNPASRRALGELAAAARSEGCRRNEKGRTPYHGYLYEILGAQGPHAPGGAYDYVVRGRMIGGFALVAHPAEYGNSGVMTFVVNHDGVVYSKDLAPETAQIAARMTRYDPDRTWKREETENAGAAR